MLIPEENRRGLKEIPDNIKDDLTIVPVKWIDQVLDIALKELPAPLLDAGAPASPGKAAPGRERIPAH